MRKILIFGNSGSGKSTLAKAICAAENLAHLDLDTLAWKPVSPPERQPVDESAVAISGFIQAHDGWAIEGCYTDLLELAAPFSSEIIFMNLLVDACIANARKRPWEPHKYESKEAQDRNLGMLIEWIAQYAYRTDTFSLSEHSRFYAQYAGKKSMRTKNEISEPSWAK